MPSTALARSTDPETSHAAADSVQLTSLESVVFTALLQCGENGATLDELVQKLGMDKVTVSPRLRPLCRKGHAVANGKRLGSAGRQQTVWVGRA